MAGGEVFSRCTLSTLNGLETGIGLVNREYYEYFEDFRR
jgi:hypothetical protein